MCVWCAFDQVSTLTLADRVSEAIREQIYVLFNYEIPYRIKQETVGWTELPSGVLRIDQRIILPKKSIIGTFLGHQGANIKRVAQSATVDLEDFLQRKVQLVIHIAAP